MPVHTTTQILQITQIHFELGFFVCSVSQMNYFFRLIKYIDSDQIKSSKLRIVNIISTSLGGITHKPYSAFPIELFHSYRYQNLDKRRRLTADTINLESIGELICSWMHGSIIFQNAMHPNSYTVAYITVLFWINIAF